MSGLRVAGSAPVRPDDGLASVGPDGGVHHLSRAGVAPSTGVSLQLDRIVDAIGLGGLVESFGVIPTIGIAVGSVLIAFGVLFGVPSPSGLISRLSRSADSGGESTSSRISGEDSTFVDEAIERLQQEERPLTGENIQSKLETIERERDEEMPKHTGAVRNADERAESAKMAVAPERIEETESYVKRLGDNGIERHARILIVANYPSRVTHGWLDQLFTSGLSTNGAEVRVSYHLSPRDSSTMKRKLDIRKTRITSQIRQKREKGKLNTTEEEQQLKHINRLREGLTAGSTKLFDFALYFEVVAEDEEVLDEGTQELKQIMAQSNAKITTLYDRQLQAQHSIAPVGNDMVRKTQIMDLQALGTTFPFTDPSVIEPSGVLMGFHTATNSPIAVDRFSQSGHNMLISGKIGSGKSYLAKLTMWRRLMMDPDTEVLIIDPVGGFGDVVEAVDGQQVAFDASTIINPLEIKKADMDNPDVEGNPYDDKLRSVMGMFEAHFEGQRTLSKEEEGVLRRAIRLAYLDAGITRDPETHDRESPTIQDVLDVLEGMADGRPPREIVDLSDDLEPHLTSLQRSPDQHEIDRAQNDAERIADFAHSVLLGLEDFKQGGQRSNLNGETTVRLQDRIVQFDLSNVADGSNEGLIMHIVLDWLFQRAKSSTGKMIIMIDEAHYMLGHDQALDMLNLFARHSRHYESGLTLISQTVDEFMKDEKAKEIYDQCDIRALMRHQDIGEAAIEALGLTERERDFVLQAQAGNSASHSESLLYVSDVGKMRMRVLSNDFEHNVIDGDENVWVYLLENEMAEWDDVPEAQRPSVERAMKRRSDVGPGLAD